MNYLLLNFKRMKKTEEVYQKMENTKVTKNK